MEVRNEATGKVFTIGVQVVTEDKFAHLGAIAKNGEGKMYIMRGYTADMSGTKIPDSMVVKPMNGRFITEQDGKDWPMKSMDRCPMYGICGLCACSRPACMHCQLCEQNNRYYKCPWMGSVYEGVYEPPKWLDAEWISRMMGTVHVEASADRIQTYPNPCTPTIQIDENWVFDKLWNYSMIQNERGELKANTKNVEKDMILFRQGLRTEEGQGDFDFPGRKVVIHPHDYRRYSGE
jgi:hypothetical protein